MASMPVIWLAYARKESPLAKLGPGAKVQVRIDGRFMYVLYKGNKEWKYSIVAANPK